MIKLQEISNYLPYRLKCITPIENGKGKVGPIVLSGLIKGYARFYIGDEYGNYELDEIEPILRPLSDLTKEIEVNGEKFVPIEYLRTFENGDYANCFLEPEPIDFNDGGTCTNDPLYWPYIIVQKLFEWHFDVFGLIERSDAIDLNTLK